ncbi:CCR4-NOT transcription complex subunit 6-like [Homalodisca vitripennis]|nr:CCR4-NOT transcription complex subunit 6-like [Homalodisca vitripennis]
MTVCFVVGLPPDVHQVHQPLLVCTAHIHWDPEFCDVKLIQVMMLSHALRGILEESSLHFRPNSNNTPVQLLLCGDFNSLPDSVNALLTGHYRTEPPAGKRFGQLI